MKKHCQALDEWIRSRLRMCYWKQWKCITAKHDNLRRLGLPDGFAWQVANTRKGYWRTASSPTLKTTLTNQYFHRLGLLTLTDTYRLSSEHLRTAVYGSVRTVV